MKGRTIRKIRHDELPFYYTGHYECPHGGGCRTCKYFENKNGRVRCMLPLPNEDCTRWEAKE